MNKASLLIAFTLTVTAAQAYEVSSHADMSNDSTNHSSIMQQGPNSVAVRFGFDRLPEFRPFHSPLMNIQNKNSYGAFGEGYFDLIPQAQGFQLQWRDPYSIFEEGLINRLVKQERLGVELPGEFVYTQRGWISRGAIREDDLAGDEMKAHDHDPLGSFYRVFNHFYNPVHNIGLGDLVDATDCNSLQPCRRAIDWATGYVDALSSTPQVDTQSRNHFSWQSAREAQYRALTNKRDHNNNGTYEASEAEMDSEERMYLWSSTFRALGDVIHLIQDMAQPQHTRQDAHVPKYTSIARQTFEAFTDLRSTQNFDPIDKEKSILRDIKGGFPTPNHVKPPVFGNYPAVMFAKPRKFFTTQPDNPSGSTPSAAELYTRNGLADFSNRSFFTAGTPPQFLSMHPLPPNDLDDPGYSVKVTQGDLWVNKQRVSYAQLTRTLIDNVHPEYVDPITLQYNGKVPLMTKSAWYDIQLGMFPMILPETAYTFDLYNYTAMADILMPRAVAYSTGMLDYFFRGELKVSSPRGGLYSVLDHGVSHTVDANGYPRKNDGSIFGFTQLRIRVANTTPAIVESGTNTNIPQTAKSGKLVAVAKYHRNPCYKPDLTGEYVKKIDGTQLIPAGCSTGQVEALRTPYQEISVSASVTIDANGNVVGGGFGNSCDNVGNLTTGGCGKDSVLAAFDFSADPIPVNATDLFVQVVYRGNLGQETDGIAVGVIDVMEPSYYSFWNSSDWVWHQDAWHPASEFPPTHTVHATNFCYQDQFLFSTNDGTLAGPVTGPFEGGQFMRVGLLMDDQPHAGGMVYMYDQQTLGGWYETRPANKRQADKERVDPAEGINQSFVVEPMRYGRGTVLGFLWSGVVYNDGTSSGNPTLASMFSLTPALSGPDGPGRPIAGLVNFSSEAEAPCSQFMPPSVPNAVPGIPASAVQNSHEATQVGVMKVGG